MPLIIVGDFNQKSPHIPRNKSVYEMLIAALQNQKIVTHSSTLGLIDHIAVSGHFSLNSLEVLSNFNEGGSRLSDHVGVVCGLNFEADR